VDGVTHDGGVFVDYMSCGLSSGDLGDLQEEHVRALRPHLLIYWNIQTTSCRPATWGSRRG